MSVARIEEAVFVAAVTGSLCAVIVSLFAVLLTSWGVL